jgi:hypothetical protein
MNRMRTFLILVMVLTSAALVALGVHPPQVTQVSGPVTLKQADGTVMVNGTSAISGATVSSDSAITTARDSSAIVSLGKLGRIEIAPETSVKLSYTNSSVTLKMSDSAAPAEAAVTQSRSLIVLITAAGTSATVITDDGQVLIDNTKKNEITIDTSCGDTVVSVKKGSVELRAGTVFKQIAAGKQDTAGQARPGCTHPPLKNGRS